ncbi:UDP-N-acetylglucosamine transferase subunit [Mactra antiquata]
MSLVLIATILGSIIAVVGILCIVFLLFDKSVANVPSKRTKSASLLAVLGSGGHTKEILCLLEHLGSHYQPRYYVLANNDKMSEEKINQMESDKHYKISIHKIPRSREVSQSWITTVISTIYAIFYSIPLVLSIKPEIILCNGPGTCIPICLVGMLLKVAYPVKIVYVESICRVETLSLSGKILYHFADSLIVQWPQLVTKYPKAKYLGRVV